MYSLLASTTIANAWIIAQDAVTTTTVDSPTGFGSHGIIWTLVIGLIVGVIAKFLTPGRDPGGCIITSLIGIGGAVIARLIGGALGIYGNGAGPGLIASVIGAIILLAIYHMVIGRKGSGPTV